MFQLPTHRRNGQDLLQPPSLPVFRDSPRSLTQLMSKLPPDPSLLPTMPSWPLQEVLPLLQPSTTRLLPSTRHGNLPPLFSPAGLALWLPTSLQESMVPPLRLPRQLMLPLPHRLTSLHINMLSEPPWDKPSKQHVLYLYIMQIRLLRDTIFIQRQIS